MSLFFVVGAALVALSPLVTLLAMRTMPAPRHREPYPPLPFGPTAFHRRLNRLNHSFNAVAEEIGRAVLPAMKRAAVAMGDLVAAVTRSTDDR